ncbi:phosphatidylinositol alpha-1,6-mannosyltransferase [Tibeticola sediminis]|uniref:Phosphatidylinositol alpha-1,6-mannosyltransferase n=2 Tax=Tibeticola sediminis TaxID=1917811 RepID=A0A3N4U7S1_9BURK|nr:phosphatidylinositol alpha-1,6-mannosyltransferase [Tibeticola sediminis]
MGELRPRLLLITRNFPPMWGGMERLNWHLAGELSKTFDVRVVAPVGAAEHAPGAVSVREVPLQPLRRFLTAAGLAALAEARRFRPQIVLAGSGLTAPLALVAARACKARSAAYVHGLDVVVPHPVYRALWLPALRRMDRVIANSAPTAQLARKAGVAPERIAIVHPGVEIPAPDPTARARFRQRWNLPPDAPVLLSVGRLTARKGLREFVQEVLPTVACARPDVVLVIVGDAPKQALYAQAQTPESIFAAARDAGVAPNVRWLGTLFGPDLAEANFGADLHVFPVRDLPGDPEGFGMVAIEAAAHGLPTVAYATGGVVDAVREGQSGRLVSPGDAAGFAQAVLATLASPFAPEGCRTFAQGFAWDEFGHKLMGELQP